MENKVFVIGIDGMDPKMTRRMVDEGKLPNIEKLIKMGSARQDLVILGANPTITPPMWTTMATGAYPATHGNTCYWNQHPTDLSRFVSAFDSTKVTAEPVWNCLVEAGKKVLVWTWPGCSWPPTSKSELLHVVDGTAPLGPNMSSTQVEDEMITYAAANIDQVSKHGQTELHGGAGCVMKVDTSAAPEDAQGSWKNTFYSSDNKAWPLLDHREGEEGGEFADQIATFDVPLRAPKNWAHEVPADALEFPIIVADGVRQLPSLLLKGENGQYDHVEIYYSKKDAEPWAVIHEGEYIPTQVYNTEKNGEPIQATRSISIMKIDNTLPSIQITLGQAMDITTQAKEALWSPKSLYQQVVDIAGYCPYTTNLGGSYPEMISRRALPAWDYAKEWHSKALLGLVEQNDYDAVFTHFHSIDHIGHACWRWAKTRACYGYNDEKVYQGFLEEVYLQTDKYVAKFMPLMEQGWTLILTSDHGLLCSEEDELPYLGEGFVMNVGVLRDLGYTVLKKGKEGQDLHIIDWEKTRAVAPRGNHIYINLKGRNNQEGIDGIVDPADKYELERQIIDDLYSYRLNGKRIVQLAIRNKDAKVLGMDGPKCGDIIYFLEEGFNRLHGDALCTTEGYFGTSVSPIFVAAGKGVKSGYEMKRQMREVDLAPTIAAIMGVRLPAQAEGAVVFQILAE